MSLQDRLPELSDTELQNLNSNALRISQSAGMKQAAAEELLPALKEELARRNEARRAAIVEKRRAKPAARSARNTSAA
jgi:hypothetical protein